MTKEPFACRLGSYLVVRHALQCTKVTFMEGPMWERCGHLSGAYPGVPSGIPDGIATEIHAGLLWAAQIDLYRGYMGCIWVPYGQLISVYNNNSCMYGYIQPFWEAGALIGDDVTITRCCYNDCMSNLSMPPSRLEPGTFVSKTIALTTNPR